MPVSRRAPSTGGSTLAIQPRSEPSKKRDGDALHRSPDPHLRLHGSFQSDLAVGATERPLPDPAHHAAGFHLLGTGRGLMLQVAHVRLADRQFVASSAIGTSSSVIWVSIRRLLSLAPRCAQGSGLSATVASINSLGLNKGASNDGETDPRWSIRCRCAGRA